MESWDSVRVHCFVHNQRLPVLETGKAYPAEAWKLPFEPNAFPVSLGPGDTLTAYIRLKSAGSTLLPTSFYLSQIHYQSAIRASTETRFMDGFFQGVLVIQLLFFLLFFVITRVPTYGYYVLYILGINLFFFMVNDSQVMVGIPTKLRVTALLVGMSLTVWGILSFSRSYLNLYQFLPRWKKPLRWFYRSFLAASAVLLIGVFFVTVAEGNSIELSKDSPLLSIFVALFAFAYLFLLASVPVLLLIWGLRVWRKGFAPARLYLLATGFLILSFLCLFFLWPFEATIAGWLGWQEIPFTAFVQAGIILQLCLFGLALGYKNNLLQKEKREALESKLSMQQEINTATNRFVPYQFLKTLGRDSILEVKLGDQVEGNFTVFFSDIRGYTTLSETMSPQDNFAFLNTYLGRVGPIIEQQEGFVNQFLGDGIMALFMGQNESFSSHKGLHAAIEIQQNVRQFNETNTLLTKPLRIGIGLHLGPLMLGVIGDQKRMDVGVVSDTVNTASRMEGLTKWYGANIIASQTIVQQLQPDHPFHFRSLGKVLVKGRTQPIEVFDCYDGDPPNIAALKELTLAQFSTALEAYYGKDFPPALQLFEAVLARFPQDQAARLYRDRCLACIEMGVSEDWTGITMMEQK